MISGPTLERLDYSPLHLYLRVHNPMEAGFRVNACQKELWTVAFIESMGQQDVLYDLGANVGSYTLVSAGLGHPTIAFEPGATSFAALVSNLALNGLLERVIPLNVALGAANGLDWFNYGDMRSGAASHKIGKVNGNVPALFHRQAIMVWRLDDLVKSFGLPMPTHIKIDVDGFEHQVLEGGQIVLGAETTKGVMLEMRLDQEQDLTARMLALGFQLAARYDERNGRRIADICYGEFRRP